jgi:hypothetical protein
VSPWSLAWRNLTGRRCYAWDDTGRLRCVLRRGHDERGRTAFERMHGAPIGFGWRFWR